MNGCGRISLLGIAWFALCLPVHGQAPIQYSRSGMTRAAAESPDRPDLRYRAAEARLAAGTFDPTATPFLEGAEAFTRSIVKIPSLQLQKAVTESVATGPQRGDVLILKWSFEEKFGTGDVILTDTPYYGTANMRLNGRKISSQEDLNALLLSLFGWTGTMASNPQVVAPPMQVHLPLGEINSFSGSSMGLSPYNNMGGFAFSAFLNNGEWFINFGVGKLRANYPVPNFIPERFPPLNDRIKSWTFAQIRNAVGDPVKPWDSVPAFTDRRDQILIAELAHRGLSKDQVVELLRDTEPTEAGYFMRLASMIQGFRDANEVPFSNRYFDPAMEVYESIGPVAGQSVSALLADVALRKCSAEFEAKAVDLVKAVRFASAGFRYLYLCSNSIETAAAIEAFAMPTEALENEKQTTLKQIRRHIEYPATLMKPRGN
jgi:hypothetical protein